MQYNSRLESVVWLLRQDCCSYNCPSLCPRPDRWVAVDVELLGSWLKMNPWPQPSVVHDSDSRQDSQASQELMMCVRHSSQTSHYWHDHESEGWRRQWSVRALALCVHALCPEHWQWFLGKIRTCCCCCWWWWWWWWSLVQCHSAVPDLLPSTAVCPASSSLETQSNSFEITRMPQKSDVLYGGTE